MVVVWRIDPEKFCQLHDWLFERLRTVSDTLREAERPVGHDVLAKELRYLTARQYIEKHVEP